MKKLIPSLFFLIAISAFAQNEIVIPHGSHPTIDGHVSPGEWDDADTVVFRWMEGPPDTTIYRRIISFKHDMDSIYFLFVDYLESKNGFPMFPEVTFDINYSRSSIWEPDDWWFHVSATDCDYQGDHDVYTNCAAVQPDWFGVSNFLPGPHITDTVEISIPLTKVGITIPDTIGITLGTSTTTGSRQLWPLTPNIDNPSNWGTAYLLAPTGTSQRSNEPLTIGPNPVTNELSVSAEAPVSVRLIDLLGQEQYRSRTRSRSHTIDVSQIKEGILMCEVTFASGEGTYRKVIKQAR
jgi:hypothetical protein